MNIEISRLLCLCRLGYKYVEATGDMEFILYYIGRIGQAFSENIIAVIESYFFIFVYFLFFERINMLQRGGGTKDTFSLRILTYVLDSFSNSNIT